MNNDLRRLLATATLPAVAILLACVPDAARAAIATTTSEAAWQSSVASPINLSFDDLPDGSAMGTQYQLLGATFSPFNGSAPVVAAESGPHSLPHVLSLDPPASGGGGGVAVTFTTPQTGTGFWYSDSQFAGNNVVLYGAADQVLASFEMAWPHPAEWLFVGFTSTAADIARVEIFIGSADRVTLDNVQFAAVPEPTPIALLLAGGAFVAWRARRQGHRRCR